MNGRLYDPVLGRMLSPDNYIQEPGMTQSFNRYTYAMNNPLVYTDPDGNFWNFVIGAAIGGFSGWQIGKAKGASGWGMVGYIAGGAAIGAATAGIGEAVTGAFGLASSGLTSASIGAYAVAGVASGAFSGAAFSALGGGSWGDIGKNALMGGLIGGATGALGGYLKHQSVYDSFHDINGYLAGGEDYAKMFPKVSGIWLDDVTVVGERYNWLGAANTSLGHAGTAETVLAAGQVGMLAYRHSLPIHRRIGTFSGFSRAYSGLSVVSNGLGKAGNVGSALDVYLNYESMKTGEISSGLFMYRTAGTGLSIYGGAQVGGALGGPYGALAGTAIGGAFTAGEQLYTGANWWLRQLSNGLGSYKYAIQNGWGPIR